MVRVAAGLLVVAAVALAVSAQAQIVFFADFEAGSKKAVPNDSVNKPENWKPTTAATKYQLSDFPGNKSKALEQTGNGCEASGDTPLPANITFTDGIIQMIVGWKDNDGVGIVFRQNGKKGYVASFQATETPSVILGLWDRCSDMPKCLQDAGGGCENPANLLGMKPHGIAPFDEKGGTAYLCRVEARGSRIRAWEVPLDKVKDPMAADLGVPPLVDVTDATHKSGTVGIFHESNPSFFDDILVMGPGGVLSVDPNGRLATTWASLKR
jgi:hypothetical protein